MSARNFSGGLGGTLNKKVAAATPGVTSCPFHVVNLSLHCLATVLLQYICQNFIFIKQRYAQSQARTQHIMLHNYTRGLTSSNFKYNKGVK